MKPNWYKQAQEEPNFNCGKIDRIGERLEQRSYTQAKKLGHLLNQFVYSKDMRTGERLGHTECRICKLSTHYNTGSQILESEPITEGPALKLECETSGHGPVVFDPAYVWNEQRGDYVQEQN